MVNTRRPTLISALLLTGTVGLAATAAAVAVNPVAGAFASRGATVGSGETAAPSAPRLTLTASAPTAPSATRSAGTERGHLYRARHGSHGGFDLMSADSASPEAAQTETSRKHHHNHQLHQQASSRQQAAQETVTYVVKRGDTLLGISQWFDDHGYGSLYRANRSVIGDDPDLIYRGEKIVISGGVMSVGGRS